MVGGAVSGGIAWGSFRLGLEGRMGALADSAIVAPGIRVSTTALAAAIVPCFIQDLFEACVGGWIGGYQARLDNGPASELQTAALGAIELRPGFHVNLGGFELNTSVSLLIPLSRPHMTVGEDTIETVWTASAIALGARIGASMVVP